MQERQNTEGGSIAAAPSSRGARGRANAATKPKPIRRSRRGGLGAKPHVIKDAATVSSSYGIPAPAARPKKQEQVLLQGCPQTAV